MRAEYVKLCRMLQRDGLSDPAFVYMGYALAWVFPGLGYRDVLRTYATFEGTAPELVHSKLCRCLLAAGMEIGPEEYFRRLREEMEADADGVSSGKGG